MTREQKGFMDVSALYLTSIASGTSEATIGNYSEKLSYYLAAMEETESDPGVLAVLSWKASMKSAGLKPSTVRQSLIVLHAFYEWAVDHGFYKENPVKKSDLPKVPKNPYSDLLTEKEMIRLLGDRRPKWAKAKYWERNRAIVILFLTTGMRNSELRHLTPADLNWEEGEIFIRSGKGDKDRFVTFPELAQVAIRKYLATPFRPISAGDRVPLFGYVCDRGKSKGMWTELQRGGLTEMVYRYVESVSGRQNIGSHDLRHAAASLMLTQGEAMENIQQDLGHKDLATTKIYAQRLRPDKRHVKSGNKIWEEIAYQVKKGSKDLSRAAR